MTTTAADQLADDTTRRGRRRLVGILGIALAVIAVAFAVRPLLTPNAVTLSNVSIGCPAGCLAVAQLADGPETLSNDDMLEVAAPVIGDMFTDDRYVSGNVELTITGFTNPDTGLSSTWSITCPGDARGGADWDSATADGVAGLCADHGFSDDRGA